MEEVSLGKRIGQSRLHARELLRKHRETYKVFWRWSDAALDHALLLGYLHTVFGWTIGIGKRRKSLIRPLNRVASRALGTRVFTDLSYKVFKDSMMFPFASGAVA